ncbi:MAG: BREX-2 system phosphatase PglZ [Gammaproteobacteria bacterium]
MNPTPEQVATQAAAVAKRRPKERIIAIHSKGGWTGDESIMLNGSRWPIAVCRSPLEMSERLSSIGDTDHLIVLTPLTDQVLSLDVLARIAGRSLIHIDPWEIVREAFGATRIDPRLPAHAWLADALLGALPDGGFSPVPHGWLDSDRAWQVLLGHYLGLGTGRPDAGDLIRWSIDAEQVCRYTALSEPLREGIGGRFAETAGILGEILTKAIGVGQGANLLPIGLVCEVLFRESGRRSATLSQAIARLEPFVGGVTLSAEQGRAWHESATRVLESLPPNERQLWIKRAEGLLAELKAERFAGLSTIFHAGFQQRLRAFGEAVLRQLDDKTEIGNIQDAFDEVWRHRECENNRDRMERLEMALKLVRRLQAAPGKSPQTLGEAVDLHHADGVFEDWARRYLLGGDPVNELAEAFGRLYRQTRDLRETRNLVFAKRLRDWNKRPVPEQGILPIEDFLEKVVAVVASKEPVLVVVIDGMDGSIFAELSEDLRRRGWARWANPDRIGSVGLLSVLPTVTEFSRTALLTGRVSSGSSATEKSGFASHAALRAISRSGMPPLLFHKGDLTDAAAQGLAPEVRACINTPEQRVVGVVINAVDDHLAKSDQLRLKWSIDSFRVLDALLYEARVAGRAVILTSDHGHVLEEDGKRLGGESEERWRSFREPLSDHEMLFEGPRILAATGTERVVLLWSEAARYCQKKNGYHGGATLQEAVVPLGVFLSVGQEVDGWQPVTGYVPEWWLESAPARVAVPQPTKKRGKKNASPPNGQASLFEIIERGPEAPATSWIQTLADSEVFAAQKRLAGRLAPPSSTVQEILITLETRDGRVPKRILAQTIQVPEFRLRGILAGLQRLLNVDGYQVLSIEEGTETVRLDITLLKKQFQLGD